MTQLQAARTYLLTLSPVTDVVVGRIFAVILPQSPTLPALRLSQVGDNQFGHLNGTAAMKWARVQVDHYAMSLKAAQDLDALVRGDYFGGSPTGLLGVSADVGGSPSVRMHVGVESLDYREDFQPDEFRRWRVMRDYQVWIEKV